MTGTSHTNAQRLIILERKRRAFVLRRDGHDYETIAAKIKVEFAGRLPLSYDKRFAQKDVLQVMKDTQKMNEQDRALVLDMELERLNAIYEVAWENGGKAGDAKSLQVCLQVEKARRELLGLDAPTKVAPTDPTGTKEYQGMTQEEAMTRLLEMLQRLGVEVIDSPDGDDYDEEEDWGGNEG